MDNKSNILTQHIQRACDIVYLEKVIAVWFFNCNIATMGVKYQTLFLIMINFSGYYS